MDASAIARVKMMLGEGQRQQTIEAALHISQTSISRIKSGKIGADVPWPNGATGPMPERELATASAITRYSQFAPEMQERILSAVNKAREIEGIPLIPTIAPEFEEYIANPVLQPEQEAILAIRASEAEHSRIRAIMEGFDALVAKAVQMRVDEAYTDALSSTRETEERPPALEHAPVPLVVEELPWDRVVAIARRVPIVAKAIRDGDHLTQRAISIAMKAHEDSPVFWSTPAFARFVHEIRAQLKQEQFAQ